MMRAARRETRAKAPTTYEELAAQIARRHDELSDRLRTIAAFAVQHPNEMALGTVSVLANRIGVQPSAIVRFANSLGYDGFTEMQQVFRAKLVGPTLPSYRERIAVLRRARDGEDSVGAPADVLAEFVADDVASLEALYAAVPFERFDRALALLAEAETIYLMAQGRSFPVAYYLDYGLCRLDLRSHLLDGVGGLPLQRVRAVTPQDVLIAVSFKDYARETVEVAGELAGRGVPVIAITDNPLGPFARMADVSFEIGEPRNRPFRSLVAPICLAQSLVVALGHRLAVRQGGRNGRRR
jgi:DNA-binding MurR/RpiR family transcriptional regulator